MPAMVLIVFTASFCYDLSNTRFLVAVQAKDAGRAATWSVVTTMIGLVGLAGILEYSPWLVIPEAAGVYVGTWWGVRTAASS